MMIHSLWKIQIAMHIWEEDDEEEETGMNSKIEKLVIVLAAVVGAIILISISHVSVKVQRLTDQENQQHKVRSQQQQKPNITILEKNTQLIIISDCL